MTAVFLQIRHPTGHARSLKGTAAGKCRVETVEAGVRRKQPGTLSQIYEPSKCHPQQKYGESVLLHDG